MTGLLATLWCSLLDNLIAHSTINPPSDHINTLMLARVIV